MAMGPEELWKAEVEGRLRRLEQYVRMPENYQSDEETAAKCKELQQKVDEQETYFTLLSLFAEDLASRGATIGLSTNEQKTAIFHKLYDAWLQDQIHNRAHGLPCRIPENIDLRR